VICDDCLTATPPARGAVSSTRFRPDHRYPVTARSRCSTNVRGVARWA